MQEWRERLDSVSRSLHRYAALPDTEKRIFRFRCRTICMDQSFLATGKKEFSQEKEFKCLTSFTRPLGNKNPRTPECARAKTACTFCFFPWGLRAAASPRVLGVSRGSTHPQLQLLPLSAFSHSFRRSEGLSRAHNMWPNNCTLEKQRSVFATDILLQNEEKGKKNIPFFTNFKLMQRNMIAVRN